MRWGRWHPVSYQVAPAAFVPELLAEHGGMAGIARLGRHLSEGAGLRGLAERPSQSAVGSRSLGYSGRG